MTNKLYGKDLKEYENIDIDELLNRLTEDELEQLNGEVDPDDSLIPPSLRCRNQTSKDATGPLNRKHLLDYLEKKAREEEDWPECKPFQAGIKRGKIWAPKSVPKPAPDPREEMKVELDLGDEYESALSEADETELVDLAAFLGLHSMLNQDQFHASMKNKGQKPGDRFQSIVKSSSPKILPLEPDNCTDIDLTLKQVEDNSPVLKHLNWNNIRNVSKEKFERLFQGLKTNSHLLTLSLANTDLSDSAVTTLKDALLENSALTSLNVESNYLSGSTIRDLIAALLETQTMLEFRVANQAKQVLGNKVEMEIARCIEENNTLLRLGIFFAVPDARVRVGKHLQKNNDSLRLRRIGLEP